MTLKSKKVTWQFRGNSLSAIQNLISEKWTLDVALRVIHFLFQGPYPGILKFAASIP
jgi:hypothetical protein